MQYYFNAELCIFLETVPSDFLKLILLNKVIPPVLENKLMYFSQFTFTTEFLIYDSITNIAPAK